MRILFALTYYRPHISGLTIYVERLANELVRRGHSITILTSRYDPDLPLHEVIGRIQIVRVPVLARVSKGVLMPTFGAIATALLLHHDALSIHLPQFEASSLALRGRLLQRPVVLTYQCDLHMPPGWLNRLANIAIHLSNMVAGIVSHTIVASTQDYADHSPYLSRFRSKLQIVPMPIDVEPISTAYVETFRRHWNIRGPVIGMAARLATEKGVDMLLQALPDIVRVYPDVRVLYVGPYEHVVGEATYAHRLEPLLAQHKERWTFLGTLSTSDMAAFYTCCDVLVLPSLNATESFGLVQVEAMLCGTPCVASNLPGVRQPILLTGMGILVPPGDARVLAQAVLDVLGNQAAYVCPIERIRELFNTPQTATAYEQLLQKPRFSK